MESWGRSKIATTRCGAKTLDIGTAGVGLLNLQQASIGFAGARNWVSEAGLWAQHALGTTVSSARTCTGVGQQIWASQRIAHTPGATVAISNVALARIRVASFLTAVLFHLNPSVAPSIPIALEKNDIRRKLPDLSFTKAA